VSVYLVIPFRTLYCWRTTRYGPPAWQVGRHLRYKPEYVVAWLDSFTAA
ncbi:MAG: excisionase/Xis, DNA-binding protein, partial [Mycobacterium sp.]|nr:excisionase/Xis, DNA-binding protein [Mycobacterium sp.]